MNRIKIDDNNYNRETRKCGWYPLLGGAGVGCSIKLKTLKSATQQKFNSSSAVGFKIIIIIMRIIFMIPAAVFHSIVPCVAILSSEIHVATTKR